MRTASVFLLFLAVFFAASGYASGEEPSPYRRYMDAVARDSGVDSVEYSFSLEYRGDKDASPMKMAIRDKVKAVFENGVTVANEKVRFTIVTRSGEMPLSTRSTSWYRDGYEYMSRHMFRGTKTKKAVPPPSINFWPEQGIVPFMVFPEEYLAEQHEDGVTLSFTLDPAVMTSHFRETSGKIEQLTASVDAVLNDDGTVRKATATGTFRRVAAPDAVQRYTAVFEIGQRGNIAITYPDDLDSYTESPPLESSRNAP